MLDFNRKASFGESLNDRIDVALVAEESAGTPRSYLGGSRLGVACQRALQYEYTQTPKDEGRGFDGQLLRIFAAGHLFEEMAIRWLRLAGFYLITQKENGEQFGFETAGGRIQGHVDGIFAGGPMEIPLGYPAL